MLQSDGEFVRIFLDSFLVMGWMMWWKMMITVIILNTLFLYASNNDEFMYMMVLQYGLDYKLLDLTNRDISSPTRQDSWNHPEQNGIAHNQME